MYKLCKNVELISEHLGEEYISRTVTKASFQTLFLYSGARSVLKNRTIKSVHKVKKKKIKVCAIKIIEKITSRDRFRLYHCGT